jgi:hypothetical protein
MDAHATPARTVPVLPPDEARARFLAARDAITTEFTALCALARGASQDAARLDWLDARREAVVHERTVGRQVGDDEWVPELEQELLGYRWDGVEGQCDSIRDAIDAAREASR